MIDEAISRLAFLCNAIPPLLNAIEEPAFSLKQSPARWSQKEIIGHLIDSATNNHHRFVRGQFEDSPVIAYDQNQWNEHSYYQQMTKETLIDFWTIYNKHLVELIKRIPKDNLQKTCKMKDGSLATLEFLIKDYVEHLEHHLNQIVLY
jgi:hypothetical protein